MTDIRGFKRICASCATRFYDFNKSPIICPKCKAEFTGVVKIRTRRGKAVVDDVKAKPVEDDTIDKVEDGDDATVSLTDLEDEEATAAKDDEEEDVAGDLDLDDLDEDGDEEDEDLEDLDDDIEIEEKE